MYRSGKPRGSYIVVSSIAPCFKFISENVGVQLVYQYVLRVLEPPVQLLGHHEPVVSGNSFEVAVVEAFCGDVRILCEKSVYIQGSRFYDDCSIVAQNIAQLSERDLLKRSHGLFVHGHCDRYRVFHGKIIKSGFGRPGTAVLCVSSSGYSAVGVSAAGAVSSSPMTSTLKSALMSL